MQLPLIAPIAPFAEETRGVAACAAPCAAVDEAPARFLAVFLGQSSGQSVGKTEGSKEIPCMEVRADGEPALRGPGAVDGGETAIAPDLPDVESVQDVISRGAEGVLMEPPHRPEPRPMAPGAIDKAGAAHVLPKMASERVIPRDPIHPMPTATSTFERSQGSLALAEPSSARTGSPGVEAIDSKPRPDSAEKNNLVVIGEAKLKEHDKALKSGTDGVSFSDLPKGAAKAMTGGKVSDRPDGLKGVGEARAEAGIKQQQADDRLPNRSTDGGARRANAERRAVAYSSKASADRAAQPPAPAVVPATKESARPVAADEGVGARVGRTEIAGEGVGKSATAPHPARVQAVAAAMDAIPDAHGDPARIAGAQTEQRVDRMPEHRAGDVNMARATAKGAAPVVPGEAAPASIRMTDPAPDVSRTADSDRSMTEVPISEPRPAAVASSAQPPSSPQHPPDLARGVAVQIAEVISRAHERAIELKLHPEELGRVSMTLSQDGNGMTVSLMAERGETLDLMRRHIDLLGEELRRLGYGTVAFSFGGGGASGDNSQPHAASSGAVDGPMEAREVDGNTPHDAGQKNSGPGSDRVDIRL